MLDILGIVKSSIDDYDSNNVTEYPHFYDTGSLALNLLLSGTLGGGIANNLVTALAGENSTGKCARGSEEIEIYCDNDTYERIKHLL